MRRTLMAGAMAATLMASPAFAQQSSKLDQILRQLEALSQRVDRLEQDNDKLEAENAELKASNERLEATSDYLRANAAATRKELAEEGPKLDKLADLEKQAKAAEWASRLSWQGDVRYRHEQVDPEEAADDQTRHRIRARFGLTARINDRVSGTVALATNGGNGDPRSTNQTLGDGLTRKGVGVDLAYVDWRAATGLNLQLGKHPYPWQRVGSYFWDTDLSWEGGALRYQRGAFFGSAIGSWLQESSTQTDATLLGAQIGFKRQVGKAKLLGALGYFDVGAVQGRIASASAGCTPLSAFFGGPQGNTTFSGGGCTRLLNDFNLLEALAQVDFTVGALPVSVFGDFIQNQEADDQDTGYALGFTLGKAKEPRSWELSYLYQDVEKDAQFGQFIDADFGGGVTDAKGSVVKVGFAPARNWVLNGTYLMNERFLTAPVQRDYDRLQLDLSYKF